MRLTWHIIRKDFLRLRLPLILWAAVQFLASAFPVGFWLWTPPAEDIGLTIQMMALVYFALALCTYDFAVRLIQEDSPADSRAFWITRPISGARLLFAKLVALAGFWLFAAAPSLLAQALFFQNTCASVLQWFSVHALIAFPAVVLATLTRSSRACLLASILIFVAVVTAPLLLREFTPRTSIYDAELTAARLMAGSLIIALSCAGVIVLQYFFRRTARAWALLIAGLLATFTLQLWWHIPLVSKPVSREAEPSLARAIEAQFQSATLKLHSLSPASLMETKLRLDKIPPGHFAQPIRARHAWEGYERAAFSQPGYHAPSPRLDSMIRGELPSENGSTFKGNIPSTIAEKLFLQNPKPAYTGTFTFILYRPEIILEVPLQTGARAQGAGHRIHILQINPERDEVSFLDIKPPVDGGGGMQISVSPFEPNTTPSTNYAILNRRTGEIVDSYQTHSSVTVSMGGVSQRTLQLARDDKGRKNIIPLLQDPEWLRDAVLVKVIKHPVGDFTREIHQPSHALTVLR